MKKILLVLFVIGTLAFSGNFDFLKTKFNAKVIENSIINNVKKKKIFDLNYYPDKLELKILEPKLNEGEVYTYTKNKKYLYSPKLKQTVEQSVSNQDESLYGILLELSNLDSNKTITKKDKKYIFTDGILKSIVAKDYTIEFTKYNGEKPVKIIYRSNSILIDYELTY